MAHTGGRPRGGARQRKHWHSTLIQTPAEFTSDAQTLILGSFTAAGGEPFTILRMLGELLVTPDEAGVVAGDAASITVGIGLVSSDAFTAGAASMPDPGGDPDYDWLWWYVVNLMFAEGSTASSRSISGNARVRIDSKAMRKVSPKQTLVILGQYADFVGVPPVDVLANIRFLVGE